MNIRELLFEYYDASEDEQGIAHLDDTRRPRLTLIHLQKLRKARDAEKYETAMHLKDLPEIYGAPPSEQPMGM